MRISRKKRPEKPLIPRYNINERIRVLEVRVIDAEDNNLGVMSTEDAISLAKGQELDLVEINPKANPPVTQILDFGSFRYQKEKEARKQKVKSHVSDLKGIRLSIRISGHDMDTRKIQAEKFLNRGDKVKAEIVLRGRENAKANLGFDVINHFIKLLEGAMPVRVEQETTKQGNKITAIIAKK